MLESYRDDEPEVPYLINELCIRAGLTPDETELGLTQETYDKAVLTVLAKIATPVDVRHR